MIYPDPLGCKDVFSTHTNIIIEHVILYHTETEIILKAIEMGIENPLSRDRLSLIRQLVNISKMKRGNRRKSHEVSD